MNHARSRQLFKYRPTLTQFLVWLAIAGILSSSITSLEINLAILTSITAVVFLPIRCQGPLTRRRYTRYRHLRLQLSRILSRWIGVICIVGVIGGIIGLWNLLSVGIYLPNISFSHHITQHRPGVRLALSDLATTTLVSLLFISVLVPTVIETVTFPLSSQGKYISIKFRANFGSENGLPKGSAFYFNSKSSPNISRYRLVGFFFSILFTIVAGWAARFDASGSRSSTSLLDVQRWPIFLLSWGFLFLTIRVCVLISREVDAVYSWNRAKSLLGPKQVTL